MSVEIKVVDDPIAECAALTAAALGRGPVVLTGGSTVKAYSSLPAEAWDGAHVLFSDERCVVPSDECSNFGAVSAAVGPVTLDKARVERIRGEAGPEEAAEAYEQILGGSGLRQSGFELFLIGLGPDAHICSMFPGAPSLDERERLVVGVPSAGLEPFVPRVTLTFPALALARRVVVMAAGAGKAEALSAAFAEDAPASREVPGSLLAEWSENITVLTDQEGASRL
ncbi:MAG: 6-phosphogluconolactonase [Solirubrobacterales bacterium]|nr:6-phosphogluconolactonase [Solirubrobacterales bacterium]